MGILLVVFFRVLRQYEEERQVNAANRKQEGLGLPPGQLAPYFSAPAVSGEQISNTSLIGEHNALLFISPLCPTCVATAMEIEALAHKTAGNVFLICEGGDADCRTLLAELDGVYPFVIDESRQLGQTFGIVQTPTAALIDSEGRIEKYGNPMRKEDIEKIAPELFVGGVRPTFQDAPADS
jgi:peroxiredoxin